MKVRITVDTSKHVAPVASAPVKTAGTQPATQPATQSQSADEILKYKTINKYSYYESGDKWVKVLIPDFAGLADHPKEKIKVEFTGERSFSVKVDDLKGENWQFSVPKTQCRILPKACTYSHKSSGLQVSLRKKNTTDAWHSLFKSKAIGEHDTDEEDALADETA